MNYESFNNLWGGIESIVTIIGLFIAACWAAYIFYLKWHACLQIVIKASQIKLSGTARYISATIEIENKGTRNTRLPYDGIEPFTVWPVGFDGDGNKVFGEPVSYPVTRASKPRLPTPATIVRAGTVEYIPFVVPVKAPGLYLLTFVVGLSSKEEKVAESVGKPKGRPASWVGKTYVVIE